MNRLNSIYFTMAAGFLLLAVPFLAGCKQQQASAKHSMVPEAGVMDVTVETLTLTTELPGRTVAFRTAEIRPQVNGLILKRLFTEGENVEKGQVLYQIDPASFGAAVESARAALSAAENAVKRARSGLKAAGAEVGRLKARLELAQMNKERYETLCEKGVISAIQKDQAVTEAKAAKEAWLSAQAQAENSENAVAEAQAAAKQAAAALKTVQINLSYTTIKAPIPGRIGRSSVSEGAIVTAYQAKALATIQQMDPIYVDVPQSTAELLRLRKRLEQGNLNRSSQSVNKVGLILEDGSRYPLEGNLAFQDITVDPSTGSVILRVVFDNPENLLLPGMFVRSVVKEGISDSAVLIPQQAVSRDVKGNAMALLVNAENKVVPRGITIDRAVDDRWLVTSGISSGDRLIVEGIQKVRPGAVIKPVPLNPDNSVADQEQRGK